MIQLPYEKLLSYDATADFIDRGREIAGTDWRFNVKAMLPENVLDGIVAELNAKLGITPDEILSMGLRYHSKQPQEIILKVLRPRKVEQRQRELYADVTFKDRNGQYIVERRPDYGVAMSSDLSEVKIGRTLVSVDHLPEEGYRLTFNDMRLDELYYKDQHVGEKYYRPMTTRARKAQEDLLKLVR